MANRITALYAIHELVEYTRKKAEEMKDQLIEEAGEEEEET